jgi:hypothetical protein
MADQSDNWLADKIAYIRGLTNPSEAQKALVVLADLPHRTREQQRTMDTLIRAEKSAERAARARADVAALLAAESRKKRAARTHQLCRSAGLLGLAGLLDTQTGHPTRDRAELLGALIELAAIDPNEDTRRRWHDLGAELLNRAGGELDE